MNAKRFKIVLTPDEEGTFSVSVPGLPECLTWGKTEAEAVRNAREAIVCCLEAREKLSQPSPRLSRRAPKILTVEVLT